MKTSDQFLETIAGINKGVVWSGLKNATNYGRIAPRNGLSVTEIDEAAGVVDCDYRGSLGVVLVNYGKTSFIVNKHGIIYIPILYYAWHLVFLAVLRF